MKGDILIYMGKLNDIGVHDTYTELKSFNTEYNDLKDKVTVNTFNINKINNLIYEQRLANIKNNIKFDILLIIVLSFIGIFSVVINEYIFFIFEALLFLILILDITKNYQKLQYITFNKKVNEIRNMCKEE